MEKDNFRAEVTRGMYVRTAVYAYNNSPINEFKVRSQEWAGPQRAWLYSDDFHQFHW